MRLCVFLTLVLTSVAQAKVPTIDDLIGVETIRRASLSPDGSTVAYTVTTASFDEDAYVTHIWLARGDEQPFPLTRDDDSTTSPKWSPDGRWLAFLSGRHEDETQIFAIRPGGG